MKLQLLYVETSKESFALAAQELYLTKIKRFADFEILKIKSPSADRESKDFKIKEESKLILSKIKDDDFLILLDERGKDLDSRKLAEKIASLESSKRVVFLIGGAFGVSDDIQKRANFKLSLSKMVMNHHVALTVLLEQIYRSYTIIKGIPYHND